MVTKSQMLGNGGKIGIGSSIAAQRWLIQKHGRARTLIALNIELVKEFPKKAIHAAKLDRPQRHFPERTRASAGSVHGGGRAWVHS